MKRTATTLALAAILAGTSHAAISGKKPAFMDKQQLATMRAEAASSSIKETEDPAFFTGKPYLPSADGYAFKYRSYSPGIARWTSEDPSGFPDGANHNKYIDNDPNGWVDPDGLAGRLVIYSSSSGNSSFSTSGHSWISFTPDGGTTSTYGTWGNNPTNTGNGLFVNLEEGRVGEVSRSTNLDDQQEQELLNTINDYVNRGQNAWQNLNPCSGFASEAWRDATGESLSDGWPISTPTTLRASIRSANGNQDHGVLE